MDFLHRTWAEIDISALIHNYNLIKTQAKGTKIMSVVKANAYGHSATDIAAALQKAGTDFFAVSNISEALQLRENNITKPILILGYTPLELASTLYENDISQCVYSLEYAAGLSAKAAEQGVNIKIHIKLDTGMSRLGFDCRNNNLYGIKDAITSAKLPNFILEGVFTHFAVADRTPSSEDGFTDLQSKLFYKSIVIMENNGLNIPFKHCCNSAALLLDSDKHLDLCRPGIILYGLSPAYEPEFKRGFIPVMTLKSVVSMVKEIHDGETVSYGRSFKAKKTIKVATVAVGYADGYPRALSNKAYVIINGKKANIIGRVCMDQMVVDVTDIENVSMGDEVILFGPELPVEILANICNTIDYEIVCGISPRVPRVIINK